MQDRTVKLKPKPELAAALQNPSEEDLTQLKVPNKYIVLFLRQFSALFQSGVPIIRAFEVVQDQPEAPALGRILAQIVHQIESGRSLSAAFRRYPKVFSKVFVTMIEVGEQTGSLAAALQLLVTTLERDERMAKRVRSALTYPIFILVLTLALTAILLYFVMPAFIGIFSDLGADLPIITRVILGSTHLVRSPLFWLLAIVALEGALYKLRSMREDPLSAVTLWSALQSIPLLGGILYHSSSARYCNAAGALLSSGHGLGKTLRLAADASGSPVLSSDSYPFVKAISEGELTSEYMKSRPNIYSNVICQMMATAEQASNAATMFAHAAAYHEVELESRIDFLAASLEPIMMAGVSLIVGTLIISTFLPLYGIIAKL